VSDYETYKRRLELAAALGWREVPSLSAKTHAIFIAPGERVCPENAIMLPDVHTLEADAKARGIKL
jgi:hypothetical protein